MVNKALAVQKGLTTKMPAVCASEKFTSKVNLSAGNRHDAPEGRNLIESLSCKSGYYLLMDRAYEDNETESLALMQGLVPVVPPKKNTLAI